MMGAIFQVVRTSRQLFNEIGRECLWRKCGVLKVAREPLSLETPVGDEEEFAPRRFH